VTEIKAVVSGRSFIDEQRFGPYKFWYHRHELISLSDTETKMTDEIHYALGFGPFGDLAHWGFVGKKLKSIFEYRRVKLEEKFNRASKSIAPPEKAEARNPLSETPVLHADP
jgi:ligand-binding SRPBCC domain-containing protein